MTKHQHSLQTAQGGFSLVEITLAMGIVSFVLVAILGLFSVGIDASRMSVNDTIVPQIAHQVLTTTQTTALPTPDDAPLEFYYTEKGASAPKADAIYTVTLTTLLPGAAILDTALHLYLIRLDIKWPQGSTSIHTSRVIP